MKAPVPNNLFFFLAVQLRSRRGETIISKIKIVRRKSLFIVLGCIAFIPAQEIYARVSITGLDDITIDAWAGATNDLQGSDTYCVISCTGGGSCNNLKGYDVAAYTSDPGPGGSFRLTNDGDGTTKLPVTFQWSVPAGTYTMSDFNTTGYTAPPNPPYAPGANSCAQPNSQNTITITVAESDLASAIAGTYSATFQVDMCRFNNSGGGGYSGQCINPVSFVVNLPELIQITGLQDFVLGAWSGVGSVQSAKDFCVFRNGYGGFSLTASGSNDSGGNFRVNDGASSYIPYTVEFSDGGSWFTASPSTQLSSSTTGFTGDSTRDCGGGTSHSMRVTMQQSDLASAATGNYSDTITLIVQPE